MGRESRVPLVVLVVATGILLLAASTAAVTRFLVDRRPSAEALLRRAERFTRDQPGVRFTGRTEVETRPTADERGEVPGEQVSSFTSRATVDGVVDFPDRVRVSVRSDGSSSELLTVGDRSFARYAEDDGDVSGEQWVILDPEEEGEEGLGPAGAGLTGFDPSRLPALIGGASGAEILRRQGRSSVVRADIDLDDDRLGRPGPLRGTLELTARNDGRVDRVVVDVRRPVGDGSSLESRTNLRLFGWGDTADIAVPGEADIDATPSIDEEAVAAYADTPLLQPSRIPAGWVLDFAAVVPADETAEECEQVNVDYVDPDDEDAGFLYLFELPVTCADLTTPPGAQAFTAGPNRGWVEVDPEEGVSAQLAVGPTVIQAQTDLEPSELARVLEDLRPLDLAVTPTALGA